jgi:hypothetical protein
VVSDDVEQALEVVENVWVSVFGACVVGGAGPGHCVSTGSESFWEGELSVRDPIWGWGVLDSSVAIETCRRGHTGKMTIMEVRLVRNSIVTFGRSVVG